MYCSEFCARMWVGQWRVVGGLDNVSGLFVWLLYLPILFFVLWFVIFMLLFRTENMMLMKLIHGTESWPFYGQQNKKKITYVQKGKIFFCCFFFFCNVLSFEKVHCGRAPHLVRKGIYRWCCQSVFPTSLMSTPPSDISLAAWCHSKNRNASGRVWATAATTLRKQPHHCTFKMD